MDSDPQQPTPPPTNPYVQPQVIAPQQPAESVVPQPFATSVAPMQPTPVAQPASHKLPPNVLVIALVVVVVAAIGLLVWVFLSMK